MKSCFLSLFLVFVCLAGFAWPDPSSRDGAKEYTAETPRDREQEAAAVFLKGVERYQAGDFSSAAETFLALADQGIENGKLYYNLGNSFFKAGDIGRAVLWYERARRLIPKDPELLFNLDYVKTHVKDRAPPEENFLRAFFSLFLRLGDKTLAGLAISGSALFFLGLFGVKFFRFRLPSILLYTTLILAVVFTVATCLDYYCYFRAADQGVVLPEKISVRSGFSESSSELFLLHAGSLVKVEKEQEDFFRIRFGKDKIGWVKKENIGVI